MKNEILTACYQIVGAAVNGTYQGILITVLVAASLRMLRRSNAATRYAVWFGTLLLLALIIPAHCLRSRLDGGAGTAKIGSSNSNAMGAGDLATLHEPSNEYAAPTELAEGPSAVGNYGDGAPTELVNADHGRMSESVRDQQYRDFATGAGGDSQSAEDRVRPFVLALLEAAAPNPIDESATPEPGFLAGIKQKLSWLGERAVTPFPSWTITSKTPLFAALFPIVWLAIAGGKVSLLIWQLFGIRRLKLNSADPSPELNSLFLTLRESQGLRRKVTLKVSTEHRSAVVLGFFKPVILLPADADFEAAENILRHELAHVRRGDDWTNLVQHFIKALFFFHPAIWWVSKRISLEREIACDDQVLQSTRRPKAYALLLADLAGRMQPSVLAPGVSTNQSQLKQRIDMILNSNRNTSPRLAKARLGLLATAAVLLAMAAIYLAPRLAFAQSADVAPAAVPPPDDPATATISAAPAVGFAASADAPAALPVTPGVPASPKYKTSSEISVDVRPTIAPRPSIAILTAPSPALPSAASVTMTPPVPVAPMVASADTFPQPGQPGTPRPARRPGKDSSLEDRLDRLEKMVESLVAQQRGKPGQFDFVPKPPGQMNWKNSADAANQWEHAQADFAKKHAEFELRRADTDKRLAELDKLKAWKDQKGPEKVKELAEQQAKMAIDQSKIAEQAAREAQRAASDAQRGRGPRKMRDGSHQELEGLHKQREMLEKQMEKLDRQIEKLESQQEQLEEQQENDEQDVDVQEDQGDASSNQHADASKNDPSCAQPAAK